MNVRWLHSNRILVASLVAAVLVVGLLSFLVVRQQEPGNQVYVEAGGRTGARTVVPPVLVPPQAAEVPAAEGPPAQPSGQPDNAAQPEEPAVSGGGNQSDQPESRHNSRVSNSPGQTAAGSTPPDNHVHQIEQRDVQQPVQPDVGVRPEQPRTPERDHQSHQPGYGAQPRQPMHPGNGNQFGQPGRSDNGAQSGKDRESAQPDKNKQHNRPDMHQSDKNKQPNQPDKPKPDKPKQPTEPEKNNQAGQHGQQGKAKQYGSPGGDRGQQDQREQANKDKESGKPDKTG